MSCLGAGGLDLEIVDCAATWIGFRVVATADAFHLAAIRVGEGEGMRLGLDDAVVGIVAEDFVVAILDHGMNGIPGQVVRNLDHGLGLGFGGGWSFAG